MIWLRHKNYDRSKIMHERWLNPEYKRRVSEKLSLIMKNMYLKRKNHNLQVKGCDVR